MLHEARYSIVLDASPAAATGVVLAAATFAANYFLIDYGPAPTAVAPDAVYDLFGRADTRAQHSAYVATAVALAVYWLLIFFQPKGWMDRSPAKIAGGAPPFI